MVLLQLVLSASLLVSASYGYSVGGFEQTAGSGSDFSQGYLPVQQWTAWSNPKACKKKADIVFLYDDSESVTNNDPDNFERMKTFMKDVVNLFSNVGPTGAQFSAVSFAREVHNIFFLKDHATRSDVLSAIGSIKSSKGSATGIGLGLEYVYKNSFKAINGGQRPGVREIVILLTDGKNNIPPSPEEQARLLKNNGVIIVAVGVGSMVDMQQLRRIASRLDLAFHVDSFTALTTISEGIVSIVAPDLTRRVPTPTCGKKEDVVFLLDESNSINSNDAQNFDRVKVFMKDIVDSFRTIGTSGTYGGRLQPFSVGAQ